MWKKFKKLLFPKKETVLTGEDVRNIHYKHFSGRVCNLCGHPYMGVAQDCKCTGYNYDE
jgi:hypothetical protein